VRSLLLGHGVVVENVAGVDEVVVAVLAAFHLDPLDRAGEGIVGEKVVVGDGGMTSLWRSRRG
jgi:hypothetical protein